MRHFISALFLLLPLPALAEIPPVGAISIGGTSVQNGVNGDCLTISAGKLGQTASCGAAAGLTVGTSAIAGGSTTNILYDNAGVLGEYTVSGTGTIIPTTVSPTFAVGTIAANTQILTGTATWNNASITFTGIKLNVTDTASNAVSLLADLQVGGVSKFNVDKTGLVSTSSITLTGIINVGSGGLFVGTGSANKVALNSNAAGDITSLSTGRIGFTSTNNSAAGAPDTYFTRVAAGVMKANGTLGTGLYTVSSGTGNPALPSASAAGAGARAYVTDAVACTFLSALTGGGSTGCPVVSNGTSWSGG